MTTRAKFYQQRQFRHLKILAITMNYLDSFILPCKVKSSILVGEILMYENKILKCVNLKSFLVCWFQHLKLTEDKEDMLTRTVNVCMLFGDLLVHTCVPETHKCTMHLVDS